MSIRDYFKNKSYNEDADLVSSIKSNLSPVASVGDNLSEKVFQKAKFFLSAGANSIYWYICLCVSC